MPALLEEGQECLADLVGPHRHASLGGPSPGWSCVRGDPRRAALRRMAADPCPSQTALRLDGRLGLADRLDPLAHPAQRDHLLRRHDPARRPTRPPSRAPGRWFSSSTASAATSAPSGGRPRTSPGMATWRWSGPPPQGSTPSTPSSTRSTRCARRSPSFAPRPTPTSAISDTARVALAGHSLGSIVASLRPAGPRPRGTRDRRPRHPAPLGQRRPRRRGLRVRRGAGRRDHARASRRSGSPRTSPAMRSPGLRSAGPEAGRFPALARGRHAGDGAGHGRLQPPRLRHPGQRGQAPRPRPLHRGLARPLAPRRRWPPTTGCSPTGDRPPDGRPAEHPLPLRRLPAGAGRQHRLPRLPRRHEGAEHQAQGRPERRDRPRPRARGSPLSLLGRRSRRRPSSAAWTTAGGSACSSPKQIGRAKLGPHTSSASAPPTRAATSSASPRSGSSA